MNQHLLDFLIQVTSTVIGGSLLTIFFFLAKEKLFRLPQLSGLWTLDSTTALSSYKPYVQMKLTYVLLLAQQGNTIDGTGEKVKEVSLAGEKNYTGKQRTQITIRGYINKRYLSKDRVVFHIQEDGQLRKSSSVYSFSFTNKDFMIGTFISTVAASEGTAQCTRGNNQNFPPGKL